MRAEFFRPEDPDTVVAVAEWDGVRPHVEVHDDAVREALGRIFRLSPVASDDPSRRALGTSGPVVVEPGDLDWFLASARVRGQREGLEVQIVTDIPGGWDPAADYRRLGDWLQLKTSAPRVEPPVSWK